MDGGKAKALVILALLLTSSVTNGSHLTSLSLNFLFYKTGIITCLSWVECLRVCGLNK